ncbi:MAG: hypothetical protein K2X32_04745 [Phycisphaerales bacterium]|nr:hypothetical protein [Phycisphaerales bacterium]
MSYFNSNFKPNPFSSNDSGNTPPGPPPLPGSGGGFMGGPPTPPRISGGGTGEGGDGAAGGVDLPPYSFQSAFEIGFESFKKHYVTLLLTSLAYVGASVVGQVIEYGFNYLAAPLGSILSLAYSALVLMPIVVGSLYVGVRAARGQTPSVEDLRVVLPRYWRVVLYFLLFYAIALVAVLPFGIVFGIVGTAAISGAGAANFNAVLIVGICFAVIAMLITTFLSVRLYVGMFRIVDPALPAIGVIGALKYSWKTTSGVVWLSLLALVVSITLLATLSVCLLVVGVIFLGLPLFIAVIGAAYAMLSKASLPGYCKSCGYSIREIRDGRCPECGTLVDEGGNAGFTAPA